MRANKVGGWGRAGEGLGEGKIGGEEGCVGSQGQGSRMLVI